MSGEGDHMKIITRVAAPVIVLAVLGLGACSTQSHEAAPSTPSTQASAALGQIASTANPCPKGMSPDQYGVCNPGGKAPTNLATTGAPEPSPSSSPASPSMTTAQEQAVEAAQGYLQMGQGFSYNSLLQQLTSSAGDGFSTADAKFAINYLHPDWKQQAVDAAQGYLEMGQGFSYESLLQQLTSSAGNGFSQADAEYAINSLHPDWDQQAVDAAKGYMQMGGFSRASLIQQLTSTAGNGFTEAQAEYAANAVGL